MILSLVSLVTCIGLLNAQKPSFEMLYEDGLALMNTEQYQLALSILTKCIELSPRFSDAYAARGEVRERLHDVNGAMIDYAICIELSPGAFEPLFSLAVVRYELRLYELAKADFLKLQHLPTGSTNRILYRQVPGSSGTNKVMTAQSGGLKPDIYNYLGLIELRLQNCHNAISYFDSALQTTPNEADYLVNRALAKKECNDPTFDDDYKKALAIDPHHSLTLHNIAVQKRDDPNTNSEQQLTAIIEADSTLLYPLIARAFIRLANGNYSDAEADYSKALTFDSLNANLWLNRGIAREKNSDFQGAFWDYTQAIELKEKFAFAWFNRGNVLLKQSRFNDAIEDYTVAILYQTDYGLAFLNRGLAKYYAKLGGACEDLKKAEGLGVKLEPNLKKELCK
jgi:tetratricopeptide (TPR) repeat protein